MTNKRELRSHNWFVSLALALVWLSSCGGKTSLETAGADSETHFLSFCIPGGCDGGLECVLGLCTRPCEETSQCEGFNAAATCQAIGTPDNEVLACDVDCISDIACSSDGTLVCDFGSCREPLSLTQPLLDACSFNSDCAGASQHCHDGVCSQECEEDADCTTPGETCSSRELYREGGGSFRLHSSCVTLCGGSPLSENDHLECGFLGEQGRCLESKISPEELGRFGGACRAVQGGVCGDVGAPDAQWECLETMAPQALVNRLESFRSYEVCVRETQYRNGGNSYTICGGQMCSDGAPGCPLSGVELTGELADMVLTAEYDRDNPKWSQGLYVNARATADSRIQTLVVAEEIARCDIPMQGLELTGVGLGAYVAQAQGDLLGPLGQLVASQPPISESRVYVSEGEVGDWSIAPADLDPNPGCEGVATERLQRRVRTVVADAIRGALQQWATDWDDTLECGQCGRVGCEIACRYR